MKKYQLLILVLFFTYVFIGCGTGPWFINKKAYKFYREPVNFPKEQQLIKTNGYYIQTGDLPSNIGFRDILIFYPDGYVKGYSFRDSDFDNELKKKLYQAEVDEEFDWYKVVKDSLIMEYFGNPNVQMITYVFYRRGTINPDGSLDLKFDDSRDVEHFEFIPNDSITAFHNKASYLKKVWYQDRLHPSRKLISGASR